MINSQQAKELLKGQLRDWPLAKDNYHALEQIQIREFNLGEFCIKVQYTPSRIISSGAKIDFESIQERPCFLCRENQPPEQKGLSFGFDYQVLVNPYPIFPEHFTIPTYEHTDQSILSRFNDFLNLAGYLTDFTIFYNGPKSGASAPDHAHFQAVTRHMMPIENEIEAHVRNHKRVVLEEQNGRVYAITRYLRNGFLIRARSREAAVRLFRKVYNALPLKGGNTEPMMNMFAYYEREVCTVIVIPRLFHRPSQFKEEGPNHLLISPGAADMGGLLVTSRLEDFEKMTPELLTDIYTQVCFSDKSIKKMIAKILNPDKV